MTDKDIIEMAQKAGLHLATDVNWMPIISLEYAKKFAELVRADERENCAKRKWVGLDKSDMNVLRSVAEFTSDAEGFIRLVEEKLKEKNGG